MVTIKPYREITPEGKYILNLHEGQTRAWKSKARFPVISAGTQGGKTCFEPDWLRREINNCGDGDYIVVTATFPLLELKLLPEFHYVFETVFRLGEYLDSKKTIQFHHVPGGTDGTVKVIDKTRIIFGSATHPESIESATAKAAVLDECGQRQFQLDSWEATRRRLSLSRGRALFGTTLYNAGWFINEIYRRAEKCTDDFELIQFDSITNPAFPVVEYQEQQRIMPPWKFNMFYRGRFQRPAGLVYDSFNADACIVPRFEIPKNWLIYVGHDFGTANPAAVFYAQDPSTGLFYLFHEYLPGPGRSTYEHVQKFKEITSGYNVISRIGGNLTTEQGWRNDFTQHGWPIQPPKETMKQVENQIAQVYALHRLNKIMVFSDCTHYLDQKQSFSYELDDKYQPTDKYEDEQIYHLLAGERTLLSSFTPETVDNNRLQSVGNGNRF
jgi:hypothetical protein